MLPGMANAEETDVAIDATTITSISLYKKILAR